MAERKKLNVLLAELRQIIDWFESQKEVDVEAGLTKVRDGVALVKESRARLRQIENEFEDIKRDLDRDDEQAGPGE